MDWRTEVKVSDPGYGVNTYEISLNKPLSYRGYRFFQSQAIAFGSARRVTLNLIPEIGGQPTTIDVQRGGETALSDGTRVKFDDFQPDFTIGPDGQPSTKSSDYNLPAAILTVTPPGLAPTRVFAFSPEVADRIPIGGPKLGYKWRLSDFEKAPLAHVLSIKYDPYDASFIAWYIGGFGLIAALGFVFFKSHRRVWARIEPAADSSGHDITIAGETNRNQTSFDEKFDRIINSLKGPERK